MRPPDAGEFGLYAGMEVDRTITITCTGCEQAFGRIYIFPGAANDMAVWIAGDESGGVVFEPLFGASAHERVPRPAPAALWEPIQIEAECPEHGVQYGSIADLAAKHGSAALAPRCGCSPCRNRSALLEDKPVGSAALFSVPTDVLRAPERVNRSEFATWGELLDHDGLRSIVESDLELQQLLAACDENSRFLVLRNLRSDSPSMAACKRFLRTPSQGVRRLDRHARFFADSSGVPTTLAGTFRCRQCDRLVGRTYRHWRDERSGATVISLFAFGLAAGRTAILSAFGYVWEEDLSFTFKSPLAGDGPVTGSLAGRCPRHGECLLAFAAAAQMLERPGEQIVMVDASGSWDERLRSGRGTSDA